MEYVILDLEWDNVYFPPAKRFVNQILQIGAVRLDSDFQLVDTFEATVRSAVSKKVSERFSKLTGITSEKMLSGIPLNEAVEGYNRFSEGAEVAMTWSNTDLYTIVDNQKTLLKGKTEFAFTKYLDLQKLVQGEMQLRGHDTKNQISLEGAAVLFGIDTLNFELHTALDDSLLCAELLRICYNKEHFDALLRDTKAPDFYARLRFKAYPISDIRDKNIDKESLIFSCPDCGGKAERLAKWKYRNRWFSALFKCKECGFKFSGRVSFKKTFDSLEVKRRTVEFKKRKSNNELQSLPETVQHQ